MGTDSLVYDIFQTLPEPEGDRSHAGTKRPQTNQIWIDGHQPCEGSSLFICSLTSKNWYETELT